MKKCYECGRKIRGLKKIIAVKDYHIPFWQNVKPQECKIREKNIRKRLNHYFCLRCRNYLGGWDQGSPSAVLILDDGTEYSFRDTFETKWYEKNLRRNDGQVEEREFKMIENVPGI